MKKKSPLLLQVSLLFLHISKLLPSVTGIKVVQARKLCYIEPFLYHERHWEEKYDTAGYMKRY